MQQPAQQMSLEEWLVESGAGGPRRARDWVRRGRVTVDGEVERDAKRMLPPTATVELYGERVDPLPRIVVYHKPAGVVTALADPWGRSTVADALPEAWRPHFHPVGRLDQDTRGLLLFSRHGDFTQRILHPKRAVEREYVAAVEPSPTPALAERLASGVQTAEGIFFAKVLSTEEDRVRLVVVEGKHRMVRRLLANAGHPVKYLVRLRFGGFTLGELAEGAFRAASEEELTWTSALMQGRAP